MVKVNVISVLIVLNFYTKISGAQSLNEIDFKMWVDAKEMKIFLLHFLINILSLLIKFLNIIFEGFKSSRRKLVKNSSNFLLQQQGDLNFRR